MNDGVYPRQLAPLGFDLMSRNRSVATVAVAMTTAICSWNVNFRAAKTLYQLYRAFHSGYSERFPSVLVQELIDYIGQSIIYRAMKRSTVMKARQG